MFSIVGTKRAAATRCESTECKDELGRRTRRKAHEKRRRTPAEKARKKDYNARRRAQKMGRRVGQVSRLKVFERDGWRCHICGKRVKRTAPNWHPLSPSLDHIIPLAAGGAHVMANVRCAHFQCNSLKRDRAMDDQLLLFG